MKFKGDIIITDPCYIFDWDKDHIEPEDGQGVRELGFTNFIWEDTLYGDWSCTTFVDSPNTEALINEMGENYFEFFRLYNHKDCSSEQKQKLYEAYRLKQEEFKKSALILGQFCADAGLVGCFLLEEVLAFNPEFNYHIEKPHTTTWIKGFDGEVESKTDAAGTGDYMLSLVGVGNINFYTQQTGF